MTIRAVVKGVGHYLPDRVVANADLEGLVDTTDAWIRTRSGIERRHYAAEGQTTSDLGTRAALAALAENHCPGEENLTAGVECLMKFEIATVDLAVEVMKPL